MAGVTLKDALGRCFRDLRVSVTDRCNFRCTYCMPEEIFGHDYTFLTHRDLLSFAELDRLVRLFYQAGCRKVRLTGGEPLLRPDLADLITSFRTLPDLEITMTTNGSLLEQYAESLKQAGLDRVTVSLDALDEAVFAALSGGYSSAGRVLDGIRAAEEAGLLPIKINMVVKRGVNENQILPMAAAFRKPGYILRFIEYMDVGSTNQWKADEVVPAAEILKHLEKLYSLVPIDPNYHGEVARRYRYLEGEAEIGIIASVTQPFCKDCTRARISADGKLFTCLFAEQGVDLREKLRSGAPDAEINGLFQQVWEQRADRYSETRSEISTAQGRIEMSYIGG
ncbi:MAG: GTP 3',8-cyclase MoaA [Anaerolineales bacterium]|nr:GTP 3',8-cyclase MoaA [Anaerolineales bacterium]